MHENEEYEHIYCLFIYHFTECLHFGLIVLPGFIKRLFQILQSIKQKHEITFQQFYIDIKHYNPNTDCNNKEQCGKNRDNSTKLWHTPLHHGYTRKRKLFY